MIVSAIGICDAASIVPSRRLAIVRFLSLPAALVGGMLATYLGVCGVARHDRRLPHGVGIAARNGIMLINHYQHLERSKANHSGGARDPGCARANLAIMMTVSCTALGLLPLLIAAPFPVTRSKTDGGRHLGGLITRRC